VPPWSGLSRSPVPSGEAGPHLHRSASHRPGMDSGQSPNYVAVIMALSGDRSNTRAPPAPQTAPPPKTRVRPSQTRSRSLWRSPRRGHPGAGRLRGLLPFATTRRGRVPHQPGTPITEASGPRRSLSPRAAGPASRGAPARGHGASPRRDLEPRPSPERARPTPEATPGRTRTAPSSARDRSATHAPPPELGPATSSRHLVGRGYPRGAPPAAHRARRHRRPVVPAL